MIANVVDLNRLAMKRYLLPSFRRMPESSPAAGGISIPRSARVLWTPAFAGVTK